MGKLEGQFRWLGENTKKCITFQYQLKKNLTMVKKESVRFMSSSLSNLVHDLSEGICCDKCIDCLSYLAYMTTKDDHSISRCFECKKIIRKSLTKN